LVIELVPLNPPHHTARTGLAGDPRTLSTSKNGGSVTGIPALISRNPRSDQSFDGPDEHRTTYGKPVISPRRDQSQRRIDADPACQALW
jgi:hypothetical protein